MEIIFQIDWLNSSPYHRTALKRQMMWIARSMFGSIEHDFLLWRMELVSLYLLKLNIFWTGNRICISVNWLYAWCLSRHYQENWQSSLKTGEIREEVWTMWESSLVYYISHAKENTIVPMGAQCVMSMLRRN